MYQASDRIVAYGSSIVAALSLLSPLLASAGFALLICHFSFRVESFIQDAESDDDEFKRKQFLIISSALSFIVSVLGLIFVNPNGCAPVRIFEKCFFHYENSHNTFLVVSSRDWF